VEHEFPSNIYVSSIVKGLYVCDYAIVNASDVETPLRRKLRETARMFIAGIRIVRCKTVLEDSQLRKAEGAASTKAKAACQV
jgi:hypothetical protein